MPAETDRLGELAFHGLDPANCLGPVRRLRWTADLDWMAVMRQGRPVIVEGFVATWPAAGRWDLASFRKRLGDRTFRAAVLGPGGVTTLDACNEIPLPFGAFADRIEAQVGRPAAEGDVYLAQGGSLLQADPAVRALRDEVVVPRVPLDLFAQTLWIGSGGNVSYLHFDPMENVLAMVAGTKRLVLFAPDQTRHVYPIYDPDPLGSAVDLRAPDYTRHPRLRQARYQEVVLEAGEALYLPLGWWHHVASSGLNIAVNVWWYPRAFQWLVNEPMRGLARRQLASPRGRRRLAKAHLESLKRHLGLT